MKVSDLLDVIFTAGAVFDGLSTIRPATDAFLRRGDANVLLARWYLHDELTGVKVMLLQDGLAPARAR